MKFNKGLLIFVLVLVFVSSQALALDWETAKTYVSRETVKEGFGSNNIRYAYYESVSNISQVTYAHIDCKNKDCVITFYKEAFSLSKDKLLCVALHEIGHWKEFKNIYKGYSVVLSEVFANDYMQSINKYCVKRYSE